MEKKENLNRELLLQKKKITILNESVQVAVRCRPMSKQERDSNNFIVVKLYPEHSTVEIKRPKEDLYYDEQLKSFTYDYVFDWNCSQDQIYHTCVEPLVASVIDGFNGCIFAYGQTGTGKTYTMEGTSENIGIIPKTFEQIWNHIEHTKNVQFLVSVSYLEIYLEEIKDLLKQDHTSKLEIREFVSRGIVIPNLHQVSCKSAADMYNAMCAGNRNRTIGATRMNEHSSRSHAIFVIRIEMCDMVNEYVKVGKLNLIDLAGSERQSKTGANSARLREASKINRALSALGNVISALSENLSHVPYRDSKLTRLLQNSLGGNSKTVMIANIGPANYNYEETLTTLRYAHRAKSIKNTPVKNEDAKDTILREYKEEIKRLHQMIEESRANEELVALQQQMLDQYRKEHEEVGKKQKDIEESLLIERKKTLELSKKLENLESHLVSGGLQITGRQSETEDEMEEKDEEEVVEEDYILSKKKVELETEILKIDGQLEQLSDEYEIIMKSIDDEKQIKNQEVVKLKIELDNSVKKLKLKTVIIDNFIPADTKTELMDRAQYGKNGWLLGPPVNKNEERPVYAKQMRHKRAPNRRYKSENILRLELDMPDTFVQRYDKNTNGGDDVDADCDDRLQKAYRKILDRAMADEDGNCIEIDCSRFDESDGSVLPKFLQKTSSAETQQRLDLIEETLALRRETTHQNKRRQLSGRNGSVVSGFGDHHFLPKLF